MSVQLRPATLADAPALLTFEQANRHYFERFIPGRGDAFFSLDAVIGHLQKLESDREQGRGYGYLIWRGDELLGRLNLVEVERSQFHAAKLGYRHCVLPQACLRLLQGKGDRHEVEITGVRDVQSAIEALLKPRR